MCPRAALSARFRETILAALGPGLLLGVLIDSLADTVINHFKILLRFFFNGSEVVSAM